MFLDTSIIYQQTLNCWLRNDGCINNGYNLMMHHHKSSINGPSSIAMKNH